MPTEVQRMPSEQRPYDKQPMGHASHPSSQWAHKEALRVAIGSILAPKRAPYSPGSRSASGTASPYSFPSSQSHSPGTGTPVHPTGMAPFGGAPGSDHLHPHHALIPAHSHHHHHHHHHPHHHPHHHTPSKLAHSVAHSPDGSSSPVSPSATRLTSEPAVPICNENLGPLATVPAPVESQAVVPARPALAPLQATSGMTARAATMPEVQTISTTGEKAVVVTTGSGTRSPKSKYVEKLQSKSAWDALIHGSFS